MKTSPRSNRLHIALFGKRNSGKSSLINALTNQNAALVSDIAGTTTDPVYQPMEIHGIGPCVFIDTAGFDDEGELGSLRIERTLQAADKADNRTDGLLRYGTFRRATMDRVTEREEYPPTCWY